MKTRCLFASLIGLGLTPVVSAMKNYVTSVDQSIINEAPIILTKDIKYGSEFFNYIENTLIYP
ncbi:MAG: hypothetical protein ACRCSQ_03145, partial [Bacteroidales bacterium]